MTHCWGKQRQCRIALLLISFSSLVLGGTACKRSQQFYGYDGAWWKNTPVDQRLGFVDGFLAYYTSDCRKEESLCKARKEFESAISTHYRQNPGEKSVLAGQVLIQIAKAKGAASFEKWEAPDLTKNAGEFNGHAWLKYSAKERMGFVEGYLNALMPQTSRSAKYPRSPEYYAKAITAFYRDSSSPPGAVDPADRQISEILWDLRSKGQ